MKCIVTEHGFKISPQNSKLGLIPSFSVPKGITCPIDAPCRAKCYISKVSKYTNGSADKTYAINYDILQADCGFVNLVHDIVAFVIRNEPRYFRWNVSGDIYSHWYLWAMCEIAQKCPDTRFLVYTKQYGLLDKYLAICGRFPVNFKVYLSEWGDYKPSARLKSMFPVAYFQDKAGLIKIQDESVFHCPGSCEKFACKHCFNEGLNVVFHEH